MHWGVVCRAERGEPGRGPAACGRRRLVRPGAAAPDGAALLRQPRWGTSQVQAIPSAPGTAWTWLQLSWCRLRCAPCVQTRQVSAPPCPQAIKLGCAVTPPPPPMRACASVMSMSARRGNCSGTACPHPVPARRSMHPGGRLRWRCAAGTPSSAVTAWHILLSAPVLRQCWGCPQRSGASGPARRLPAPWTRSVPSSPSQWMRCSGYGAMRRQMQRGHAQAYIPVASVAQLLRQRDAGPQRQLRCSEASDAAPGGRYDVGHSKLAEQSQGLLRGCGSRMRAPGWHRRLQPARSSSGCLRHALAEPTQAPALCRACGGQLWAQPGARGCSQQGA